MLNLYRYAPAAGASNWNIPSYVVWSRATTRPVVSSSVTSTQGSRIAVAASTAIPPTSPCACTGAATTRSAASRVMRIRWRSEECVLAREPAQCTLDRVVEHRVARHREPEVVDQPVLQPVDPAVHLQRLAAPPRVLHDRRATDVRGLLQHVQLAQPVNAVCVGHRARE